MPDTITRLLDLVGPTGASAQQDEPPAPTAPVQGRPGSTRPASHQPQQPPYPRAFDQARSSLSLPHRNGRLVPRAPLSRRRAPVWRRRRRLQCGRLRRPDGTVRLV